MASEPLELGSVEPRPAGDEIIPLYTSTVAAFIGRTERGPLNEAVAIASFEDYRRAFGGHCTFSFLSFAVQHFFAHGGENAVVVRVGNRATRALLEIPAGSETLRLQARQPGSHEYLRVSIDYDRVEELDDKFNLVVQRLGRPGSQLVDDQELFQSLSMNPADDRFVVDVLEQSELIRLAGPLPGRRPDATRALRPGEPIPYLGMTAHGTDGDELTDYDIIGSNGEGTGLFALDRCPQIDFLCIPSPPGRDLGTTSFVAATRYCERRRALLIWDPPWSWTSADAASLAIRSLEQASAHVLTYFPRLRPRGDLGRYANGVPASGVIAGVMARCDQAGVWHELPPTAAALKGNLLPLMELDAETARLLHRWGVNTFERVAPAAAVLRGNVTFAGVAAVTSFSQRLSSSRTSAFILRSIERHTRWVFNAECSDELAADLERQVWIFLARLNQRGALAGRVPEQAFVVRTSEPRSTDGSGFAITLRVGFAPEQAYQFVTYDFRYRTTSATVDIVPVRDAERPVSGLG